MVNRENNDPDKPFPTQMPPHDECFALHRIALRGRVSTRPQVSRDPVRSGVNQISRTKHWQKELCTKTTSQCATHSLAAASLSLSTSDETFWSLRLLRSERKMEQDNDGEGEKKNATASPFETALKTRPVRCLGSQLPHLPMKANCVRFLS